MDVSHDNMNMNVLSDGLNSLGISYNADQLSQINLFYDMLIEKNKVMNLTAITEYNDFIVKHVLDSLLIFSVEKIDHQKIIDVGPGAGFPGIPIKIFFPDTELVLMDSLNKRLLFINEVISNLNLKKITTVHGRAEDIAHDKLYREKFDICVSRAVSNLSTLSELCIPFAKINGKIISYKSSDINDELAGAENAIKILGGSKAEVYMTKLPDSDITRSFIVINKKYMTSNKYPRKAGTPLKQPL